MLLHRKCVKLFRRKRHSAILPACSICRFRETISLRKFLFPHHSGFRQKKQAETKKHDFSAEWMKPLTQPRPIAARSRIFRWIRDFLRGSTNFECKAFLPQSFKGSCYQIWCIVTGGAYQSAREVTWCVRNDYKTGSCLNCTRRTHQTRPSAPFLPHLFRQGGKDGAAGGASETLCWFAAWVCPRRIHKTAPFRSNGAVHAYMGGGSYSAEMR